MLFGYTKNGHKYLLHSFLNRYLVNVLQSCIYNYKRQLNRNNKQKLHRNSRFTL